MHVPYWSQVSGAITNEPLDPGVMKKPFVDVGKAPLKRLPLVFDSGTPIVAITFTLFFGLENSSRQCLRPSTQPKTNLAAPCRLGHIC